MDLSNLDHPKFTVTELNPAPKPKRHWWCFGLGVIAVILLAWLIGRSGRIITAENTPWSSRLAQIVGINPPIPTEDPKDPNPMPKKEADRLDFLLLGIRGDDQKSIETEGGLLTDTILIASINKTNGQTALISIPRDLSIDMIVYSAKGAPVQVTGKINQAYERGLAKSDGLGVAQKIFSKVTGIYIDQVVVFDFNAFQSIVEQLGGIDIYLAQPFKEPTQWGYEFSLPAGNNHLNGQQALYYVRSRFSSSDFDRSRRQQQVIAAIKSKALTLNMLKDPNTIISLYKTLRNDIRTTLQLWDISDLIKLANSFKTNTKIKNLSLTTDNLLYETKTAKGEYILLPKGDNFSEIQKALAGIVSAPN